MKTLSFNWFDSNNYIPVRICVSDNLGPLLPHSHSELELMYFYRCSECRYLCNGTEISCRSNDLIAVNPGEIHSCSDWGADCSAVCVIIDTAMLPVSSVKYMTFANTVSDGRIKICFEELKLLFADNDLSFSEKECKIYSIIYNIFSILSKYSVQHSIKTHWEDISEILRYIDTHISSDIAISALAEKYHLSRDRFNHVFKDYIGLSPVNYILRQRIKKSCELLKNTDMTISEIAMECNFCTSAYFCKKFSEYMQTTPTQYRSAVHKHEQIFLQF